MATKTVSTPVVFIRSLALGLLLSILAVYAVHVLGNWKVEAYRPDADTTYSVVLHNHCLLFETEHTLRPNTAIPPMDGGINGTKLGGSFLIFSEGHIPAILLMAFALGGIVFFFRRKAKAV